MIKNRLPPLGALRAFHAVAECLSFKRAAQHLSVSATAISHQIRLIESMLECRVFERNAQGVNLTEMGQMLYSGTQTAFAALEDAVVKIDAFRRPPALTITTTSNFLTNWLVPRLADFKLQFPHIDLRLHTGIERVDLTLHTVDVAIRYREMPDAHLHSSLLYEDRFIAVASPSLKLKTVNDLNNATLFHIENRHVPTDSPDWKHWQRCFGPQTLDLSKGLHFSDETHAVQAAVAGQGVVIASQLLVGDLVKRGMLTVPFEGSLPGARYYLVTLEENAQRADIEALRQWILQQMMVTDECKELRNA